MVKIFTLFLIVVTMILAVSKPNKTSKSFSKRARVTVSVFRQGSKGSMAINEIPNSPEKMVDFLEFFEFFDEYGEIIDAEMEGTN